MTAQTSSLANDFQSQIDSKPAMQPSLADIRTDFEERRKRNQEKILLALKQRYPELDENELINILKMTE